MIGSQTWDLLSRKKYVYQFIGNLYIIILSVNKLMINMNGRRHRVDIESPLSRRVDKTKERFIMLYGTFFHSNLVVS